MINIYVCILRIQERKIFNPNLAQQDIFVEIIGSLLYNFYFLSFAIYTEQEGNGSGSRCVYSSITMLQTDLQSYRVHCQKLLPRLSWQSYRVHCQKLLPSLSWQSSHFLVQNVAKNNLAIQYFIGEYGNPVIFQLKLLLKQTWQSSHFLG